jgi:hypothetical protein
MPLSPSKYQGLTKYLATLPPETNAAKLTFAQIEAKIDSAALPPSARDWAAWWSNGGRHTQAAAWLSAGWRTADLDLRNETVTFVRQQTADEQRASPVSRKRTLTIAEAKAGLASSFGVPESAIEITVKG